MTILNSYTVHKSNLATDLAIAKAVQKKLILPKLLFCMMPLLFAIALIYKLYTGNNAFNNNVIFIAFVIYMLIIIPLIIILTLIGSICPHCYKFQSLNGRSIGIEGSSFFIFKGISPFIHYCSRCGAPLSEKAIDEVYRKHDW